VKHIPDHNTNPDVETSTRGRCCVNGSVLAVCREIKMYAAQSCLDNFRLSVGLSVKNVHSKSYKKIK